MNNCLSFFLIGNFSQIYGLEVTFQIFGSYLPFTLNLILGNAWIMFIDAQMILYL